MLREIVTNLSLLSAGVLFSGSLYDAVVLAPNLRGGPAGLEHGRLFMARATPANLFRIAAPVAQMLTLLAVVNGAAATIDFLKQAFGAVELRRFPDESGKLKHAEVRIDDTVVMLADPVQPDWPPVPSYVHIYVRDVDTTYRKALAAGAVSAQEPLKKQDEDKRGGVKDTGGTTWWIATKLE